MMTSRDTKTWRVAATALGIALLLVCGAGIALILLTHRVVPAIVDTTPVEPVVVEPQRPEREFAGIEPTEGAPFEEAPIAFTFNGGDYLIEPQVANGVYWGAYRMQRALSRNAAMDERALFTDFYRRLTFDTAMDDAIGLVAAQLRAVRDEQGFDADTYAEFIIKYVQTIPYDYGRLDFGEDDEVGEGDPRMPVQTLVDGTGDCDEKVMLAVALLNHEGYSTAMLLFEDEEHMALGLAGQGPGYLGSGYEFVEMTSPAYVSEPPGELADIGALTSTPMMLVFAGGPQRYSQEAVDEVAFILRARDTALEAAEAKRQFIETTPLTDDEFAYHLALYEACYFAMNSLQMTINDDGSPNMQYPFLDRLSALEWLAQNYWWE
jgi:hypothetical protein